MGMRTLWVPTVCFVFLCSCAGRVVSSGPVEHETRSVDLDQTEMARVELRMGAGELNVAGNSPHLMDADFAYDNPALKPAVHYTHSSFRGQLRVEQPNVHSAGLASTYEWKLRMNNEVPLEIVTNLGAGNADMDLRGLSLRSVEVHMGVGNLDMNLRGQPTRDYDVEIDGGVGNATVRLPAGVGIVADAKGGIGNIETHGLKKRDGRWVNAAHESAKVNIHLNIRGGIGNITLVAD